MFAKVRHGAIIRVKYDRIKKADIVALVLYVRNASRPTATSLIEITMLLQFRRIQVRQQFKVIPTY